MASIQRLSELLQGISNDETPELVRTTESRIRDERIMSIISGELIK